MKKFLFSLVLASLAAGLPDIAGGMAAHAANPGFCANYANTAVAQQRRNLRLGCGYSGLRWHERWGVHYGWCLAQPRRVAQRETRIRRQRLRQCAGPVMVPRYRTFRAPRIRGVRLDWCKYWGRQCGLPAANAFCRRRGFRHAVSFAQARDIGRWVDTRIIGTGQICSGDFCDGFRYITCAR